MERRKEKRSKAQSQEPLSQKASEKVALDQWFYEELKRNRNLKASQLREIAVFMKKQGLSEKENREAYQRALAKY